MVYMHKNHVPRFLPKSNKKKIEMNKKARELSEREKKEKNEQTKRVITSFKRKFLKGNSFLSELLAFR